MSNKVTMTLEHLVLLVKRIPNVSGACEIELIAIIDENWDKIDLLQICRFRDMLVELDRSDLNMLINHINTSLVSDYGDSFSSEVA